MERPIRSENAREIMFFCASESYALPAPEGQANAIAVSGSPPTNPVVSKTSGTVYEKALIERYIGEQLG